MAQTRGFMNYKAVTFTPEAGTAIPIGGVASIDYSLAPRGKVVTPGGRPTIPFDGFSPRGRRYPGGLGLRPVAVARRRNAHGEWEEVKRV